MFQNDPAKFQLILKDGKDLSPCIICYSMDKEAINFITSYPSGRGWKPSQRPYHFEMPDDFKLGDMIEVGYEVGWYRKVAILQFYEKSKKRMRFVLEDRREQEKVERIDGIHWIDLQSDPKDAEGY